MVPDADRHRVSAFDNLITRARGRPRRIVLPEGLDERVIRAAITVHHAGLAVPVLLGDEARITACARALSLDWPGLEVIDPATSMQRERYRRRLLALRAPTPLTDARASREIDQPLNFAALMIREGDADGCVAGAQSISSLVMRTALRYIGNHPDSPAVSSFFIMLMHERHPVSDVMLLADCALTADPDAEALAAIAIATGHSAERLLDLEPQIAMLSYSTAGSARHRTTGKVVRATAMARQQAPQWRIIGEVQLDAAVVPAILARKAAAMATQQPCNILIFPNLDAGNIGYKLLERFGGARAIGPITQGLLHPLNDLSRGCEPQDIVDTIVVTAAQCE